MTEPRTAAGRALLDRALGRQRLGIGLTPLVKVSAEDITAIEREAYADGFTDSSGAEFGAIGAEATASRPAALDVDLLASQLVAADFEGYLRLAEHMSAREVAAFLVARLASEAKP